MIKKVTFLLMSALLLTACNSGAEIQNSEGNLKVFIDKETGCEYLLRFNGGVTPRIDADGVTHKGCKEGEENG